MKARQNRAAIIVSGVLLGAACAGALGLLGLHLLDGPNPSWLVKLLSFAVPLPWGAVAGGFGAGFLMRRAQRVQSFARLLGEACLLGAGVGLTIFALSSVEAGTLGPPSVLSFMTVGGACSAALIGAVLRPLYWTRLPSESHRQ